MPDMPTIPARPPEAETQDFGALLRAGLARVQTLSGDHWTDFNEHDPGVTILEALCFALTDAAYRIGHPIEDILSSSAAATGVGPECQPLFPAHAALTSAPLTENDYRKLICDAVPELRNVWLFRRSGAGDGDDCLCDVLVQPVPASVDGRHAPDARPASEARILAEVAGVLRENRNLGEDFGRIEVVGEKRFAIDARIEIGTDHDPDSTVARLIFNLEMRLNPTPERCDIAGELRRGRTLDEVFAGPKLARGAIADASLRPLDTDVPEEAVRAAALELDAVEGISLLGIEAEATATPRAAPTVSRRPADIRRIGVFRDGIPLEVDPGRVQTLLRHYEQDRRWHALNAIPATATTGYARVPEGNARRALARYRSIQHFFPAVYGIGRFGIHGEGAGPDAGPDALSEADADSGRLAETRQLKGYLLFFEQLLADLLAQLENTNRLFSFGAEDHTYFWQSLARPGLAESDAPPNIAPVLGDRAAYEAGLDALVAAGDHVAERRNRALDHLLARFNEAFDGDELRRLIDNRAQDPDKFLDRMVALKRGFLEDWVALSARRGLGVTPHDPGETPLEKRIRLKSGLEGRVYVIEHVLLRTAGRPRGIGELAVGRDFRLAGPGGRAARLADGGFGVHLVIDARGSEPTWSALCQRLVTIGRQRRSYRISPPGGYRVSISIDDGNGLGAALCEEFPSVVAAEAVICRLVALFDRAARGEVGIGTILAPALLPTRFFDHSASVFVAPMTPDAPGAASAGYRNFVERTVAENMPAHIDAPCYWLETEDEAVAFRAERAQWLAAIGAARAAGSETADGAAASDDVAPLRQRIHRAYCRALLARRFERYDGAGG